MRIGFCGAHRTGKSTLAALVTREFGLIHIPSPVSGIVANHGFDMATQNRLDTGMDMQAAILADLVGRFETAGPSFVSDRTPIDVAAYALADATAYAGDLDSRDMCLMQMDQAVRDTERLFDIVILVPPAITFEPMDGKPPLNAAYQEHHHMLCRGLLFDEDLDLYWDEILRPTLSIGARMDFVRGMIAEWQVTSAPAVAA